MSNNKIVLVLNKAFELRKWFFNASGCVQTLSWRKREEKNCWNFCKKMAVVHQTDPTSISVDNFEHQTSSKRHSRMYLPSQGMLASDGSYYIPTRPIRGAHMNASDVTHMNASHVTHMNASHVMNTTPFGSVAHESSDEDADANNDGESMKSRRNCRRKSIIRRMWRYVKESWLGVMSGTGKKIKRRKDKYLKNKKNIKANGNWVFCIIKFFHSYKFYLNNYF